jgi:hypothetical protein
MEVHAAVSTRQSISYTFRLVSLGETGHARVSATEFV